MTMPVDEQSLVDILAGVRLLLAAPAAMVERAEELSALFAATGSRAVGVWRHEQGVLHLAGFLADNDMPADVQQGFVSATRHVPLTRTEFGIVQAVQAGGLAVNHRAAVSRSDAVGSIGWLGRLEAASSLATPIFQGSELQGAVAVATKERIEPDDAVWRLLARLPYRFQESIPR